MPCYLFTYHGHGTWFPDNPRGYVRRKQGIQKTDSRMATCYRRNLKEAPVVFSAVLQRHLLAAAIEAFDFQSLQGHFIATEASHLHALVSWRSNHTWQLVRRRLRSSLTRRLNRQLGRRPWFSKQPSRKQVCDRRHFDHLVKVYLPNHSGLKWTEERGVFR